MTEQTTDIPNDGYNIQRDDSSGKRLAEGLIRNAQKTGPWKFYDPETGMIKAIITFENGVRNGEAQYFVGDPNEQEGASSSVPYRKTSSFDICINDSVYTFVNDVRHGPAIINYQINRQDEANGKEANGSPKFKGVPVVEECTYVNGIKTGEYWVCAYDSNAKGGKRLIEKGDYTSGEFFIYDENQNLSGQGKMATKGSRGPNDEIHLINKETGAQEKESKKRDDLRKDGTLLATLNQSEHPLPDYGNARLTSTNGNSMA